MRIIFALFFSISVNFSVYSQQQVPGSNCETWTQNFFNTSYPSLYYWEMQPSNIWASSNAATTIVNSFCLQRTTDAYSGLYAAYLETKSIFTQPAAGNLFTGYFIANGFNSKAMRGIPFTGKPSFFRGYYKYTSVSYTYNSALIPDSCAIYAILSKWNGSHRIVVADAIFYSSTNVSVYTEFNIPFTYYLSDTPDSISMVFASSKNGEFYRGGIGSKLYIDDVSLEYPSVIENNTININYYFAQDNLYFDFGNFFSGDLIIYDLSGKRVCSENIHGNSVTIAALNFTHGLYNVILMKNGTVVYTGKMIK